MRGRRPSGEIINATLLEIFLSFVFVVLAVAWFHNERAEAAEAAEGQTAELLTLTQSQVDSLQLLVDSLELVKRGGVEKPRCLDQFVFEVAFTESEEWEVLILHTGFGFTEGQRLKTSPATFESMMASYVDHAYGPADCRFRIYVRDTDALSKAEYKRAVRTTERRFYVAER